MTVFRANTDLANQVFSPTRVWAGTDQTTFNFNDPVQIGDGFTVSGEDITLVTPQIGVSDGSAGAPGPFTIPTRGLNEIFTGTLDLRNSTIDMYNRAITIVSATRSATQLVVTFTDEGFATALAGVGATVREIIFQRSSLPTDITFRVNSTATITAVQDGSTVTLTLTGNTETAALGTFPQFVSRINTANTIGGPTSPLRAAASAAGALGGSNGTSLLFDDVRFSYVGNVYNFIGNFHARTAGAPLYTWNNVQFEGDIDDGNGISFLSMFSGSVDNASTFNNVSFWNRINLGAGGIKGGTWQTTSNNVYNNTLLGPFGNQLNDVAISRMLFRFANQGRTDRGITNHAGLATNFDFRSVGQVTGSTVANASTLNWFIDVDTGARIYFINWLPGRPQSSNNFTFSNIFNASSGNTRGGMAHVCVGTNPNFNNPGVTDTNHILTFTEAQINRSPTSATDSTNVRGVFQQAGAWDVNTLPTYRTSRVLSQPAGGLIFEVQHADFTNRNTAAGSNPLTNSDPIRFLESPEFRKYSWSQQPDNTSWGRLITVTAPPDNATDSIVAAAREQGYDIFNGTTWETSTNYIDPTDQYVELLGADYATPILAAAQFANTGRVNQGTHIPVAIKSDMYAAINETSVNANNDVFALPYGFNGQVVETSVRTVLDGSITDIAINSTGNTVNNVFLPVPAAGITPDSLVVGLNVTGTGGLELQNNALSLASTAAQAFTYEADTISFATTSRPGTYTARALTNGFRGMPTTITSNMNLNGRLTFSNVPAQGHTRTTQTFEIATDTSNLRIENVGSNTVTVVGKQQADFLEVRNTGSGSFIFQGVVPVTLPQAGRYFVGRRRAGVYTAISTSVQTNTAGQVIELSGADFESTDQVAFYYKPDDTSNAEGNFYYSLSEVRFLFSAGAQTLAAERISPQLLLGVTGSFTPGNLNFPTTNYNSFDGMPNGGVAYEINVSEDLDLAATKRFFLFIANQNSYLNVVRINGYGGDSIAFSTNGISVHARAISIGHPAGVPQYELTGVGVDETPGTTVNAATDSASQDTYVIRRQGGIVDFINQVVPSGITTFEVINAVQSAQIFQDIGSDLNSMRTNRLLGIRPQTPTSGGDFTPDRS